ncbi:MAG: hypothetical protein DIU69_08395, partial [Bacillota bacterium]
MRLVAEPLAHARFPFIAACCPESSCGAPAPRWPWRALRRVLPLLVGAAVLLGASAWGAPGALLDVRAGQAVWAVRTAAASLVQGGPAPGGQG